MADLPDFNEHNATDAVLARHATCSAPRLRTVMDSIVRHLHAVVREVEPSPEEWMQAILFLTRTGHMSGDVRQEFILLSDVLGVSMLVDTIANRTEQGSTESTVLGPFHVAGSPVLPLGADICKDGLGEPVLVEGVVMGPEGPLAGAELDVWQTSHDGFYDVQQPDLKPEGDLRGRFKTDTAGRFWFRTIKPASYPVPDDGPVGALLAALERHPYRPAHIHFIVSAPGHSAVVTHLFADGDPYLASDAVFGVKASLIVAFERIDDAAAAAAAGMPCPFLRVRHDFHLAAGSGEAAVTFSAGRAVA